MGGTQVTINGDGFTVGDTRLIIAGIDYTSSATITYTQINFTTPTETTYVNRNLTVLIVIGTNNAVCLAPSCTFQWSTSITPYFDSVSPSQISGPTVLTLTGRSLTVAGGTTSNTKVTIGGTLCNVTSMTNSLLTCEIGNIEAGNHTITGLIDGLFSF